MEELRPFLNHYGCDVLSIEEQLGNRGGWTVTLNGENPFSKITYGEPERFSDTANPQFYWSVSLCYPTREKTRQAPKPRAQPSFPREGFPSLGGPSFGGSSAPDVQNWVKVAKDPSPKTESLSDQYVQAQKDLADAQRVTAEAMEKQKAAEKALEELRKRITVEQSRLSKLLVVDQAVEADQATEAAAADEEN